MSVLGIDTSIRYRSTTATAAHRSQPRTAQAAPVARVLTWTTTTDGIWTAQIGTVTAGSIHRTDAGFQVHDWEDTIESIHPTLAAAQLSLEPAVRAAARTTSAAIRHRAGLLASSTVITALLAATGVITAMVATHI